MPNPPATGATLSIFTEYPALDDQARKLADQLQVPFQAANCDFQLVVTPLYLGIKKTAAKGAPFYIDFLTAQMTYRRKHATVRKEILARALGLKNQTEPKIIDATAGLGRDSFILASLGFQVAMWERSAIIYTLLQDGLRRAQADPQVAPIVQRMQLTHTNALNALTPDRHADAIYLDPMFPERSKSALVKKDMQIFHALLGSDEDADQLLNLAVTCAAKRVVVKRPRTAGYVADKEPTFSLKGSSSRFDIYLK